eukprot:350787-Chlamydomonas_euryale.AAC.1
MASSFRSSPPRCTSALSSASPGWCQTRCQPRSQHLPEPPLASQYPTLAARPLVLHFSTRPGRFQP